MASVQGGILAVKGIQRPKTAFNDPLHGHNYNIWRKKTSSEQVMSAIKSVVTHKNFPSFSFF